MRLAVISDLGGEATVRSRPSAEVRPVSPKPAGCSHQRGVVISTRRLKAPLSLSGTWEPKARKGARVFT